MESETEPFSGRFSPRLAPCQTLNSSCTNETYRLGHTTKNILGLPITGNNQAMLGMDHRPTALGDPNVTYGFKIVHARTQKVFQLVYFIHTHMVYESDF